MALSVRALFRGGRLELKILKERKVAVLSNIIQFNNVLKDVAKNGKERPWKDKKQRSVSMANVFHHANLKAKALRMRSCGNTLVFNQTSEGLRLSEALFCQIRLCPMCTWRRSLKISFQNKRIIEEANKREKLRWLFLTLTVKNVEGEELLETVNNMMGGWNRFAGYKRIKDNVVGWFRGLEITRNEETEEYHPHFHVLLCVKESYFKKKTKYISQEEWTSLWQKAMKLSYTPIVDIRAVKARQTKRTLVQTLEEVKATNEGMAEEKAVFEVSKYPVKDTDVIDYDDIDASAEVVKILDKTLTYKRLIAYGGLLKDIKKELQLEDVEGEDANLVNVDDKKDEVAEECLKVMAYWNYGLKEYIMAEVPEGKKNTHSLAVNEQGKNNVSN